jgi:hypothetical protein
VEKLKPNKKNPVDLHNQRGKINYNSNSEGQLVPFATSVVNEERDNSSNYRDVETYEAEGRMWSLLKPYCLPTTPVRRPLPALQLRPGVAERLVENDGRLELTDIADAMWDSVQRRKETRK